MKSADINVLILLCVTYGFGAQTPSPSPSPNANQSPNRPQRFRVSSGVMAGLMTHRVDPVYPREAKKKHIKGDVILRVLVDKQGQVVDVAVIKGDPMFTEAAMDAVKQWRFKPYLLNGEPIEVESTALVSFGK